MRVSRVLLISLCLSSSAFAMSLQQVFENALQKNENIPSQQEAVVQAEENVKQAWGSIIPTLTGTAQWAWQAQYKGPDGALSPDWNPLTKLTLAQPIFQGYREWNTLDQMRKLKNQQAFTKENTELTVFKSIISSYYQILYLEKDKLDLQEEIRYINDEIKLQKSWLRIGRSQTTDVLMAQSSLASTQVLIEQDNYTLRVARDTFALNTGLPADTVLDDDAQGFEPKLEPLEKYLDFVQHRPDVKSTNEAMIAAEDNINVQKSGHVPTLGFQADRYFLRAGVQQNVDWDAMLTLSVPIFEGGTIQSKVRAAYSQSRQAELALSLAQRTAIQEVRQYYDSVRSDLTQLELNLRNVQVNQQYYKEEERFLRLGLVPYLNVITALTSYMQAKRTLDQNIFQLKGDHVHLKAAVAANKENL